MDDIQIDTADRNRIVKTVQHTLNGLLFGDAIKHLQQIE